MRQTEYASDSKPTNSDQTKLQPCSKPTSQRCNEHNADHQDNTSYSQTSEQQTTKQSFDATAAKIANQYKRRAPKHTNYDKQHTRQQQQNKADHVVVGGDVEADGDRARTDVVRAVRDAACVCEFVKWRHARTKTTRSGTIERKQQHQ